MIPALWILAFTILVGIILYIGELRWRRKNNPDSSPASMPDSDGQPQEPSDSDSSSEECCGLHLVCEKDPVIPITSEILYYDDEELDRFVGRTPESYSPEETEEFRDVLMTLRADDIPGWAASITQRNLQLPPEVRDELLMLLNDLRQAPNNSNT